MKKPIRWSVLAMMSAMALLAGALHAQSPVPSNTTVITIPGLHCSTCAKGVETRLAVVPGVGGLKSDVDAKITEVYPKGNAVLSPRALWEAVEKSGKRPTRLQGPNGVFTAKPQF